MTLQQFKLSGEKNSDPYSANEAALQAVGSAAIGVCLPQMKNGVNNTYFLHTGNNKGLLTSTQSFEKNQSNIYSIQCNNLLFEESKP